MTFNATEQASLSTHFRRAALLAFAVLPAVLATTWNVAAATFTVTSIDDTAGASCGATCTLRQAINAANADGGASETIAFNIDGALQVIHLANPLPPITHANLTINGYTQPGAAQNTLAVGDDAVVLIVLEQAMATLSHAVLVCASNVTIKGLSIGGLNGGSAIDVGDSTGVGGGCGIGNPVNADHAVIQGNFIGETPLGGLSNLVGVRVDGSSDALIGGTTAAARNLISRNSIGIVIRDAQSSGAHVYGNYIGLDASGTQDRGNTISGVVLTSAATGATIGGVAPDGAPNRIAFNNIGINVAVDAVGNRLAANDIFGNFQLGIDLCGGTCSPGDGVTENDVNDNDDGGNNLQNFPVLTTAKLSYGSVIADGTLDVPHEVVPLPHAYAIALYANAACDKSGNGQGDVFLGSAVALLADGGAIVQQTFSAKVDAAPAPGTIITATATDPDGNTSEFSDCLTLTLGDGIFKSGVDS